MHSIYFEPGEAILFQVPPKNPLSGQWIKNIDDLFPKGFSEVELQQAMVDIYASSHDAKLVTESIEFADVDSYYNPGIEEIPYDNLPVHLFSSFFHILPFLLNWFMVMSMPASTKLSMILTAVSMLGCMAVSSSEE